MHQAGGPDMICPTNLGAPFAVFASGVFDFLLCRAARSVPLPHRRLCPLKSRRYKLPKSNETDGHFLGR